MTTHSTMPCCIAGPKSRDAKMPRFKNKQELKDFMRAKYAGMLGALTLQPQETISSVGSSAPTKTIHQEKQSKSKDSTSTETPPQGSS